MKLLYRVVGGRLVCYTRQASTLLQISIGKNVLRVALISSTL